MKIEKSVGIHDGHFHADEVTACALLVAFGCVDRERIIRTRDPALLEKCEFVCDVGGLYNSEKKQFDHHQVSYLGELSSAGMILKYLLAEKIIQEEEYRFFYHSLIQGVDDHDNGRSPQIPGVCTFSHVIANFNPPQYDAAPEEQEKAFREAFIFALGQCQRMCQRHLYNVSSRKEVEEAMERHQVCLLFDRAIPWLENFFALGGESHPALFVIMPSKTQWKLRGIPPTFPRRMEVRLPLPLEWAGLLEEDLQKVSNIPGAVFCHKGRFTSVWEKREDALKALQFILKTQGIPYDKNHL
ncbi:MAG: hypothetical protein K940chlam9_01115 [Chlamydiae bacterium]|nr:hypothetical protein [Chlamydiota bacterium]